MQGSERDDALRELGRMAAECREAANMSLEDVFERTRIRLEYLRGIESGNYTNFPELVYVKGFIRTYLKVIGGEDLQADFMAQLDRVQPRKQEPRENLLGTGTPPTKGFKPVSHLWLVLVLLAALAGTAGYVWYAWSNGELSFNNLLSNPLARFTSTPASVDTPDTSQNVDLAPIIPPEELALELISADVEVESEPELEPEPEPQVKPSLTIAATNADCWMRVSIGGKTVYERTMRKGESMTWELTGQARALFGRPSAVSVTLNGKNLGIANSSAKKSEAYVYSPNGTVSKAN